MISFSGDSSVPKMLLSTYMTAGSSSIGGHFHGYLGGEWQHLLSSVPFIATYDAVLKVNLYLQTFGFTEPSPLSLPPGSESWKPIIATHTIWGKLPKGECKHYHVGRAWGAGVPKVAMLGEVYDEMSIKYLHQT